MREYRYLVQFKLDDFITEFQLTASGTGEAIQKAKRLFESPISVAPIRKGVNPYDPKYEISTLEKEYYGSI